MATNGRYAINVWVRAHEDFETLLSHPLSVRGAYDPYKKYGMVVFVSVSAATAAREELN